MLSAVNVHRLIFKPGDGIIVFPLWKTALREGGVVR